MDSSIILENEMKYQGAVTTGGTLDRSKNMIQNFLMSAKRNAGRCAFISEHGTVSYGELLDDVKKTASKLKKAGITSGELVGVYCRQNYKTISLIYAVLYLGAVYVPLSSDYPEEKICHIIECSNMKYVAGSGKMPFNVSVCYLDVDEMTENGENIEPCLETEQFAYCMFTSGTTGVPKGVCIKQAYLLNMCEWYGENFNIVPDSRLILLNNFGFDGSLKTIFTPLLYGASIVAGPDKLFDIQEDIRLIEKYEVTHLACVPSLMQGILISCAKSDYKPLVSVKYFISAGEKFRSHDVLLWSKSENCHAVSTNLYGPAECSCCVSFHTVTESDLEKDIIPIGNPIYNKRMYILNDDKQPCAVGEEGNIWIAGFGTFGGYIGMSPEQSGLSEDIIESSELMYNSGDRGMRLENGEIIYLGRKDNQIKISGQRIEIEEIEQVLLRNDKIESAGLCITGNGEQTRSVMFYKSADGTDLSYSELSDFMGKYLSAGVIPNRFIRIDDMPLTNNGKLDRIALAEKIKSENSPEITQQTGNSDELTSKIIQAWKNTLEIDEIPLESSFFELGGYSMLFYKLQSEIKEQAGKDITIAKILEYPTPAKMLSFLKGEITDTSVSSSGARRVRRRRIQ
ncbi:MAG: non-ribosomal peptide synthetase [Ruminococcus flavefaciens]|nr:non-ribosomal peptide synthetase [Ruminococcus flavefaciens]